MTSHRPRTRRLSDPTIGRLPLYQRIVNEFAQNGTERIESLTIAERTGITATTVRRDLAGLGPFGTRGAGYDVAQLNERISVALGHDRSYSVILVGIGNLGQALINSSNFLIRGATLAGLYDVDPAIIGTLIAGHVVRSIEEPLQHATVGVICTPASVAQSVADRMVAAHIPAILNFSPSVLQVPIGTKVQYVDLSIELQVLVFHLLNSVNFADMQPSLRPATPVTDSPPRS